MSRFRIKKQPLIAVAGIVWLLAGLNVAILGVRAAIDVRDLAALILLALAGGAVAIFCAFHPMFSKLVQKNAQRIAERSETARKRALERARTQENESSKSQKDEPR